MTAGETPAKSAITWMNPYLRHRISIACLLAILLGILLINFNEMWLSGHHGFTGSMRSTIGRNYVRYGFVKTRLAPVTNQGRVDEKNFSYRWNHPILSNVLVGVAFRIFGEKFWAARLFYLVAALLSGLLVYLIGRDLWGEHVAVWALIIYTFSPLVGIYGTMANYESIAIFFILGSYHGYLRWRRTGRYRYVALSAVSCSLALWTDWPAYLFIFFLFVYDVGRALGHGRGRGRFNYALILGATVLLNVGLICLYYTNVLHAGYSELEQLFKFRTSTTLLTKKELWRIILGRSELLLTRIMSWVSIAALLVLPLSRHVNRNRGSHSTSLLFCMLFPAVLYLCIFKQHAWIHCFSAYYLLIFVTFGSAALIGLTFRAIRNKNVPAAYAFGIVLVGLYAWTGVKTTIEGKYTHGSIAEGRKKHDWQHYELLRWLREQSEDTDRILFFPSTPFDDLQGEYYLDRSFSVVDHVQDLESRMREGQVRHVILSGSQLENKTVIDLMGKYAFTVFNDHVVFHPTSKKMTIDHLSILEHPFTFFSRYFSSLIVPPHERYHSPMVAAKYWLQHRKKLPEKIRSLTPKSFTSTPLEDVMLYDFMLLQDHRFDEPAMAALEKKFLGGMSELVRLPVSGEIEWVGTRTTMTPQGDTHIILLFKVLGDIDEYQTLVTEYFKNRKVRDKEFAWSAPPLAGLTWRAGEYFMVELDDPKDLDPTTYTLVVREKGTPALDLEKYPTFRNRSEPFMARLKEI